MTNTMLVAAGVAASSLAVGCHDQPTLVVLVVNSDLVAPSEVNRFDMTLAPGPFAPPPTFPLGRDIGAFPKAAGIVSQGETASFSFVARLLLDDQTGNPLIVVSKTVTDVRFVPEQTRMLLLDLPRSCACQGTSCPLPGNPVCDRITNPALMPFDQALAPGIETAPRFAAEGPPQ